jgi:sugar lactone lactonase YvrE
MGSTGLKLPTGAAIDGHQNLFVTDRDNHRVLRFDRPAPYPVPEIQMVAPGSAPVGEDDLTLIVFGTGFIVGAVVRFDGTEYTAEYHNFGRLTVTLPAAALASVFNGVVIVENTNGVESAPGDLGAYYALRLDTVADRFLGQPNFTATLANPRVFAGVSAHSLRSPAAVALDPTSGRLYVADQGNHRVLSWPSAAALDNGEAADLVIGQRDFYGSAANRGAAQPAAGRLNMPQGLALDAAGNLYVADYANNRVLEFDTPAATDGLADRVFGQPDMNSGTANNGGINAAGLAGPGDVVIDALGRMYVSDSLNHRILRYDAPLASDAVADLVLGQAGFTANLPNRGNATPSSAGLAVPIGLGFGPGGRLAVADTGNHRVLAYPSAPETGSPAVAVVGQPGFTSNIANNGGLDAGSLNYPLDVAADGAGNLYVADSGNHRVLEYDVPWAPGGGFDADRVFGQLDLTSGTANLPGAASASTLNNPALLAVEADGQMFLADLGNSRVLAYLPALDPVFWVFLAYTSR